MISNQGKEILRDVGMLAENIICEADRYDDIEDKEKLILDMSDTALRMREEMKQINIRDLEKLYEVSGVAVVEYTDMLDDTVRKEPYSNNQVKFKADAVVSIVLDIIHREMRDDEVYRKISKGEINENVQV